MKLKKITSIVLALIMIFSACGMSAFGGYADIEEHLYYAEICFRDGIGPETNGYTLDYRYFSPVTYGDTTKYPLVIWLHGIANGSRSGSQLTASDIEAWATDELQSRFKGSEGAFILAPRSLEEEHLYWEDSLIYPLRATIDDFIAKNKDNIDLSRIYIGGYSLGGKMTLKMAIAYPEMFAAAFPICPAWVPSKTETAKIADMPIWLTSAKNDHIINYYLAVKRTWNNIISESNVADQCRFTTLSKSAYPDGTSTPNGHQSWFSVNYDMFSSADGDYPYMSTVDGNGNTVKLTYPEGMISWLSGMTSDYDGAAVTDGGNSEDGGFILAIADKMIRFFKTLFVVLFKQQV